MIPATERSALPVPTAERAGTVLLVLYCLGFAFGGTVHLVDVGTRGLLPYTEMPLGWNAFMTSLAVLNPLAVVLLLVRRRAGLLLALLILALVLAMNLHLMVGQLLAHQRLDYGWLYLNGTFCAFVFATAPRMWRPARPPPGGGAYSRTQP